MAAPNLKEIENGIYELEHEESSKAGYALLAALYTCRNEMLGQSAPQPKISAYSEASGPVDDQLGLYGESEFLRAVEGKDPYQAWAIMDEHMNNLRMFNPRVYAGVMRKLSNI